jgi:hypothetical protein
VGLVFVAPVIRRVASCGHELAAIVFLQNDVATEVAKRSLQNIEDELGAGRSTGFAAAGNVEAVWRLSASAK